MKKFIFCLTAAAAVMSACQKMPSAVDADGEFLVATSYDQSADFSSYSTFTVADSVLVIDSRAGSGFVKTAFTNALIDEYKDMMQEYGYQYVPIDDKDNADLGIQLTYISDTDYYVNYVDPYWWLDYPGYWSTTYWGTWGGGWYYSYPVVYESTTHSLSADMADLKADEGEDKRLPVLWSCVIDGNTGSVRSDSAKFITAIRQAFAQSSYLDKSAE